MTLTFDDILAAQARLKGHIERTPCRYSRTLSEITGAEVWVKFENLQFTAAYKERGALNKLLQLGENVKKRGVICASAGNHSQALAYHAARLGIPVTIVMPRATPFVKVQQTRNHGAEVVIDGDGYDEASAFARKLCDERDWLLMLDEVQCGIGRTGKWFAHQWAGIKPDVMPLAKGLGSGVPIGAVVAGEKAAQVLQPGNHGTTFGGNPLAMRAGVETLRIMEEEGLLENAARVGEALRSGLARELAGVKGVTDIRGQGLMIGIELDRPCGVLLTRAMEAGLLLSVTADKVIRLVPPLILTQDEAAQIVAILCPLIKQFLSEPAA